VGVLPIGILTPAAASSTHVTTFPALIDTGATATCISPAIVQAVGLQPIGRRQMVSATESIPVNVYLLLFPFGAGGLILPGAQVMEFFAEGGNPFQMLVGRDIICRGTFTISFDGHFAFCL
jgi:hypothetical protein